MLVQDRAQVCLHALFMILFKPFDSLLVKALISCWVLTVDIDLVITKLYPLSRLLSRQYIKSDFVVSTVFIISEHGVLLHFLPARSEQWVILHGLVEKIERVQRDANVCGPAPRAIYHLIVEVLHSFLALGCSINAEDEHAGEHLVENDADGPHVDLVVVARTAPPVSDKLLGRHHQG